MCVCARARGVCVCVCVCVFVCGRGREGFSDYIIYCRAAGIVRTSDLMPGVSRQTADGDNGHTYSFISATAVLIYQSTTSTQL